MLFILAMGWGAGQQSSRAHKGLCVQEQCKRYKKQWYPHGREPVLHLRLCGCNVTETCNWGGYSDLVQWTTKRTELHTGEQMAFRIRYRAMYWWCLTTLYVQWYHSNRIWHTKPITTQVHVCYTNELLALLNFCSYCGPVPISWVAQAITAPG